MRHRMGLHFLVPGSPAPDSSLVASPRAQSFVFLSGAWQFEAQMRPLGLSASVGRMGGFREGQEGWE